MDIAIRRATHRDLQALLALYEELAVAGERSVSIEHARARFLELAADPAHEIHVAEHEGRVVGTFALIFIGGLSHGARGSCIVEDVVVAPALQGKGIGRTMMQFAMARCAERDCYKLVLSSHVKREEAHRFYDSLGFRKHGYSYLIEPPGGE